MAAMATTFKLARQQQSIDFQHQIIKNCKALNDQLHARGFRIPFNGTNTHLTNIDCKSIVGRTAPPCRATWLPGSWILPACSEFQRHPWR
jgi:glycine hydroxymethyltransferase